MMDFRKRIQSGAFMAGTWCSLGSPSITELIGLCGFDWVLLDGEHAPSTTPGLMAQMQALNGSSTSSIVRIPWLDRVHIKWALDIGAEGIMVPYVENAEQAMEAVSYMKYPPSGARGVAGAMRACRYGLDVAGYLAQADSKHAAIMQIENRKGVDNCRSIAGVDGVDVLFVGPMDLSMSLGMPGRFSDPCFMEVLEQIASAAREEGKASGILLPSVELLPAMRKMGYSFIAVSSDINILAKNFKKLIADMNSAG